jgi:hypothetical protein
MSTGVKIRKTEGRKKPKEYINWLRNHSQHSISVIVSATTNPLRSYFLS